VGILFGAICYRIAEISGPAHGIFVPALPTLSVLMLNLVFLPWIGMSKWPSFPFNSPAWSLSVEMIGNLVYAVAARTLSDTTLKALSFVGACGLCLIVYRTHSLDCGVDADNAFGGFVRFAFSFPLGVLLYRYRRDGRLQKIALPWPFVLLTAAVIFAGVMPLGGAGDLLATLFVFPLLLVAALSGEPATRTARYFAWAGALSYPLYIVHHPILDLLKAFQPDPILWWLAVPVVVAAAALLERLFDAPLQRRLAAGLSQNRASA
jgi:peptidoglycan/LPS O-acetylase OafA/YrhL